MPPSTSSSVTRSAFLRPTCGWLLRVLSILVTRTGWFGVLPLTGSPVSGHSAASSVPPATGWESGFFSVLVTAATRRERQAQGGGREHGDEAGRPTESRGSVNACWSA